MNLYEKLGTLTMVAKRCKLLKTLEVNDYDASYTHVLTFINAVLTDCTDLSELRYKTRMPVQVVNLYAMYFMKECEKIDLVTITRNNDEYYQFKRDDIRFLNE